VVTGIAEKWICLSLWENEIRSPLEIRKVVTFKTYILAKKSNCFRESIR
jgi:hypothetical protein